VPLPFHLAPSQLPAPLPSEEDILASTTTLSGDASHSRVVAIGPHYVAKHGRAVSELEGQNLLFLEQHANGQTTAPRLYAMYRSPSTGHVCLVMERLQGQTLESLWPGLAEDEKSQVCAELKKAVDALREIPAPGFYGGVGRTCVPCHLFWDREQNKEICGPFDSEAGFNAGLVKKLRSIDEMNAGYMTSKVDYYERHVDAMLTQHAPVFTHLDLQRKNIMVSRRSEKAFDWEDAGWYPSYWEYSINFATMQWSDDWPGRLEQAVAPWPVEAAVLRMLYQDLWF
jgi:hypothetical protein